ncbi:MAG: DUF99 family protein [Halobacteriaceae archaeon]
MKSGVRALGIAASGGDPAARSTLAGAVVRADRAVDGLRFGQCTVGGTDATAAIARLYDRLNRPDVRYVITAGVALAWYNMVDIERLAARFDRPVVAVSFEASPGLSDAIRAGVANPDPRLAVYERLPERVPVTVNDEQLFVRAAGCSRATARDVIQEFTPTGGRPEPVRVARLAARAGDAFRRNAGSPPGLTQC